MSNNSISRKNSLSGKNDKFEVVIMSNNDKLGNNLCTIFPLSFGNSKNNYKYLNRYILSIRENIRFPKDFPTQYHKEIIDKLQGIDILLLIYNISDKLSFENILTFYYLYFTKLEDENKPKNIIILERDCCGLKEEINFEGKIDPATAQNLANLFNSHFCSSEDDLEKINRVFDKCLKKLLIIYNYIDDYSSFKYKELNKEINSYILIYGDKSSQNMFLNILLNSKCDLRYKKIKDNFYEIHYSKLINDNSFSFKIILKLVNSEYYYDSECNIFLYDVNNRDSYESIRNCVRGLIKTNGAKFKKIYELFALNSDPNTIAHDENDMKIKEGKNISYEIGANFSYINTSNDCNLNEEIKIKFDKILEQIINYINMSKVVTKEARVDSSRKLSSSSIISNNSAFSSKDDERFFTLIEDSTPRLFIKEVYNRIKKELKKNQDCLFNICPKCFSQLNIKINESSNIIITYCDKCNTEPIGISLDQFIELNKLKNIECHCNSCKKILYYDFNNNKLTCQCENNSDNIRNRSYSSNNVLEEVPIPLFLKDCYCEKHNNFHQYYLKYSKEGLCASCNDEKKKDNFFIEKYNSEDIDELIQHKTEEIQKEKDFINSLQIKFNECIDNLKLKFGKYLDLKIKKNAIKSDIIRTLQIIKNNNTLISNVKSLEFDFGDKFKYEENDTIENRIKYIFNYLHYDIEVSNIYFEKNNNIIKDNIHINNSFIDLIQKKEDNIVTDIWGLKNNELICVSYNNGKAKIYDLNNSSNKNIPICVIDEFGPREGVNSLYVSKSEYSFWKNNDNSKYEIIYLNGFENIKIIQPNNNYSSYQKIYIIKDEMCNISNSIEIDDSNCLYLTMDNNIKLISFNKDNNNDPTYITKFVNDTLFDIEHQALSINKLKDNVISLYLTKNFDDLQLFQTERISRFTLYEDQVEQNEKNNCEYEEDNENKFLKNYVIKNVDLDNLGNIKAFVSKDNKVKEEKKDENNNEEQIIKLIEIKINADERGDETIMGDGIDEKLKIVKQYIFNKNYELLGVVSEQRNIFLLKFTSENNKKQYDFYLFDFSINQFIYHYKLYNNTFIEPKLLIKITYNNIFDKQGFIILCKDLTIGQYFYDENYNNRIYRVNCIKLNGIKKNLLFSILSFIPNSIL